MDRELGVKDICFERSPARSDAAQRISEVSRDYFPFEEVATSFLENNISGLPLDLHSRKDVSTLHSATSSIYASNSDPMAPFSTGGAAPSLYRPSRPHLGRSDSQTASISTSPIHHRHAHRSNSNLASAFTASLSRPFSFTASASSSPPMTYPRKRLSPTGSYLGAAPPGVTWGSTSFFGKSSTISEDPKPAYSRSNSDAEKEAPRPQKPAFNIKLKNQDQFRNDGYADVSLLDPDKEWRYRAYRESYAHMLYIWEMTFASCEILKHNNDALSPSHSPEQGQAPPLIAIGKITAASTAPDIRDPALNLRNHCTSCSEALPLQSTTSERCPFCKNPQTPLICILCTSLIRGLASPCLACGHVLHLSCRSSLLSLGTESPNLNTETKQLLCVSGCGCDCASHTMVEVENVYRRKSSASMTVTGENTVSDDRENIEWKDNATQLKDEDAWEDVAYESLTRNLSGRYLTPRPSQIWRGEK